MPFSLFRRKVSTYSGPLPVFDELWTIPEFGAFASAFAAGEWTTAERELAAMPHDEAEYALFLATQIEGSQRMLEAVVEEHSRSPWARTALAMRFLFTGWEIRTSAPSDNVSAQQWEAFHEWVTQGETLLTTVIADHPDFAPAWYARVLSARAAQVAPSELGRRARRHAQLSPDDLTALQQVLQFHLPKWFGSDEVATDFARTTAGQSAPGSNGLAIIALRHLDRWADLGGGDDGAQYLGTAEVREELSAASRRFLSEERSLGPVRVQAHSAFLMGLALSEQYSAARRHLEALGTRASAWPWTLAFETGADLVGLYALVLEATDAAT